jgi:hypothetical protein
VAKADIKDKELAELIGVGDPNAFKPPVHLEQFIPRRDKYQRIWEEVKAA